MTDNFEEIRPGDRVTILTPQNQERSGRVVMKSGDKLGWVLNCGGKHGTPALAYPENTVKISKGRTRGMTILG